MIVPCHRVVGSNGSLTGFGGGIDKKIAPLEFEGAMKPSFKRPKKGHGTHRHSEFCPHGTRYRLCLL
ncbi:MGMT family protein [Atopobium sp. oral taxon 416]|uniref:MGMT family protein n=1 Tax=Atopobium sp. oral taxon 416 TaxID=712157 RepID=UPI0035300413